MNTDELPPEEACREAALRLLDHRGHTVSELRRKLSQRSYSVSCINAVIDSLLCVGLLNDRVFAEAFCEERALSRQIGRRRMFADLRKRGVDAQVAEEALAEVWDREDGELERARAAARNKWRTVTRRTADLRVAKQKVARFLAGRGFSSEVVWQAVNELADGGS